MPAKLFSTKNFLGLPQAASSKESGVLSIGRSLFCNLSEKPGQSTELFRKLF